MKLRIEKDARHAMGMNQFCTSWSCLVETREWIRSVQTKREAINVQRLNVSLDPNVDNLG